MSTESVSPVSNFFVAVHSVEFCEYDNVYKITWNINGKLTNAFSSRGKRIGKPISLKLMAEEHVEAVERGEIVKDYLTGLNDRKQAMDRIQNLKHLCPKNPKSHLLTMAELALGLR